MKTYRLQQAEAIVRGHEERCVGEYSTMAERTDRQAQSGLDAHEHYISSGEIPGVPESGDDRQAQIDPWKDVCCKAPGVERYVDTLRAERDAAQQENKTLREALTGLRDCWRTE